MPNCSDMPAELMHAGEKKFRDKVYVLFDTISLHIAISVILNDYLLIKYSKSRLFFGRLTCRNSAGSMAPWRQFAIHT